MPNPVDVRIDRETPVPLYHQLAEQLSAAIASGQLQPGDAFENEVAMADRLGLSRPTVRRAIQELVGQGLLLRRRGLGTTVAGRQIHRRAELTSLYDDLRREGSGDPRTAGADARGDDRRGRRDGAGPAGRHPAAQARPAAAATATARSRSCATGCRPPTPTSAARTSSATASTPCSAPAAANPSSRTSASAPASRRPPSASTSNLTPSQPVLTMSRTAFDAVGGPVEYGDHCYRAQDYSIEVMLDER